MQRCDDLISMVVNNSDREILQTAIFKLNKTSIMWCFLARMTKYYPVYSIYNSKLNSAHILHS